MGIYCLKDAEQAELFTVWPRRSDFVIATHRTAHGFPLAASRELRRRGLGDSIQDSQHVSLHFSRTSVKKSGG